MTVDDLIIQKMDAIDSRLYDMDKTISDGNAKIESVTKKQEELTSALATAWKKYDSLKMKMDRFMAVMTGIVLAASFLGVPERMLRAMGLTVK